MAALVKAGWRVEQEGAAAGVGKEPPEVFQLSALADYASFRAAFNFCQELLEMGFISAHIRHFSAAVALSFVTLVPALALAHPGHGSHGFASGFGHPLLGWDHLLAMVAVGIWAAQRGGKALWVLPVTFVVTMVVGGALGVAAVALPGVEGWIMASVLVLGGLIAAAVKLPLLGSAAIVAAFALFHGHAHGTEMAPDLSGAAYGLGFATSTALLHGAGVALPVFLGRRSGGAKVEWVRFAGAGIGLAGLFLIVGG